MLRMHTIIRLTISMVLLTPILAQASEMILKSGEKLEGKIIEQTDKYVKFDAGVGVVTTYYNDEIDTIDGQSLQNKEPIKTAETAEDYMKLGNNDFAVGNLTQAISDFTKAIEINPNLAEVYYNRGLAYKQQSNFTQAISDFTKAIAIDPNYLDAYFYRGPLYLAMKEYDKAWADLHKEEELGRTDPMLLAEFNKASGMDKSVFANSEDAKQYFYKGATDFRQQDYNQSISNLTKAIGLDPNNADYYCFRGLVYSTQGNYDQSISDLDKAIEINPNDADAYGNRGLTYYKMKDYDKSWADVNKSLSLGESPYSFTYLNDLKKVTGRDK